MLWPLTGLLGLSCLLSVLAGGQTTLPLASNDRYQFSHKIERVAVIGAGGTGLLHSATLIEHGFRVRMFEKQTNPGGNWLYNDKAPLPAAFPCVTRLHPTIFALANYCKLKISKFLAIAQLELQHMCLISHLSFLLHGYTPTGTRG